jgi:hypothetical protein
MEDVEWQGHKMTVCEPQIFYPCSPYITADDILCKCSAVDLNVPADVELFNDLAATASQDLFVSTGSKYTGCCEISFVPCREKCENLRYDEMFAPFESNAYGYPSYPMLSSDTSPPTFINCWACTCDCDTCNCWGGDALELPFLPAREITEVLIDGVVLDPANYRILESTWIVRTDGGRWPPLSCDGGDDAFKITYRYGWDLPPAGKRWLASYVCELVKNCKGLECALTEIFYTKTNVISKDKMERFSPEAEYLDDNLLTGFPPLDRWIMRDRGGRSLFRPTAWPPDPTGRIV